MMNWQHVEPSPHLVVLPPAAASLDEAHGAIDLWEHYTKKRLDPDQRLMVEIMLAEDAGGQWAARTTGREKARQNGKGEEIEVVELWGLVQRGEAILHTVHDAVLLATQTQQRMLGVLESRADLRRRIKRRWTGTGQQMIEMTNGGVIWYRTRTSGGGRGVDDISRLVVDEAQHATEEHLAAMSPTLLANPNPQMNILGTAGLMGRSAWWWSIRRRALSADPGSFGYLGHTAERVFLDPGGHVIQEPVDVEDRSLWHSANPVIAAGRVRIEFFEEQLRTLGAAGFAREHLCVWDPEPMSAMQGPVDLDVWGQLAQVSTIESHRSWALAVSADRKWAAIGLAGRRADNLFHVEWMDHRAGTGWVVERCQEAFQARGIPLRVHGQGAEASLVAQLREAGVEVLEVSTPDVSKATGAFIDAVADRTVRHLGQRSLDQALGRATVRTTSAGAQVWSEPPGGGDITTLKAVTVALGGVPLEEPVFDGAFFVDLDEFLELDE